MRVKARDSFQFVIDATIGRKRLPGEEWEVSEERGQLLLSRGLVRVVEEKKKKTKKAK